MSGGANLREVAVFPVDAVLRGTGEDWMVAPLSVLELVIELKRLVASVLVIVSRSRDGTRPCHR